MNNKFIYCIIGKQENEKTAKQQTARDPCYTNFKQGQGLIWLEHLEEAFINYI